MKTRKLFDAELRHARHYLQLTWAANALFDSGGEGMGEGLRRFREALPNIERARSWSAEASVHDSRAADLWVEWPTAGAHLWPLHLSNQLHVHQLEVAVD